MAMDWDAYFSGGDTQVASKSPDKINWDSYFSLPNQEPAGPTKPRVPGFTPDQEAEMASRQPTDTAWPLGNPITDPNTQLNPVAAVAQLGAGAAKYFGMDETNAAKLGRDIYALPNSMGPLGYEYMPLDSIPRPTAASDAKLAIPTAAEAEKELLKSGGRQMNVAKGSPDKVAHEDLRAAMTNLNQEMKTATLRPDPKLHPAANDLYGRMLDLVRAPKTDPLAKPGFTNMPPPPLKEASMERLHELKQIADDVIAKGYNAQSRQYTSEGKLGVMMKNSIEEMISKHPASDLLKAGSSEYARGKKSQALSNLIEQARNTTQWDRGDHAGAIRNKVNSFLKSEDSRFLNKDEIKELRKIKRYGFIDALGGQGSLSPMAFTIGRLVESMFGIPPGGLYVAGKLARDSVNASKPAQLERMAERIRAGK